MTVAATALSASGLQTLYGGTDFTVGGAGIRFGAGTAYISGANNEIGFIAGNNRGVMVRSNMLALHRDYTISWDSSGSADGAKDLHLQRDAANTLAQRNGTAAQTVNAYNTYTDASNYRRISFGNTAPGVLLNGGGTGLGGTNFDVGLSTGMTGTLYLLTDGSRRWKVANTGHFLAEADNTYDIGASGATRPRNIYAGSAIISGTGITAGNGIVSLGGNGFLVGSGSGVFRISNPADNDFTRLNIGGTTVASPAIFKSGSVAGFRQADGTIATFANLPAAAAGNAGAMCPISDSTTVVWGATITGGGSNHVLAYSNGTAWTVLAK